MSLEEQHDSKSEFKRKRSESPVSTSMTCEHADLTEGPSDEYRNKRVKTERPASPAPSFLSLKSDLSMAPPMNFKGGEVFPLDLREKLERPASPTTSYLSLKTDWSKDAPDNFKAGEAFHVHTRVWPERAPSPTLSSVSELTHWFDQPTNFKAEPTFHLDPRLLTENHLKCPVCKSILKDPVSIPCGHNFCRDCISSSWEGCAEDYVCPQCRKGFKIRPELNTNTALAEVVKHIQQAGFSPALPPCSYAGPEDVACDFCSDQRLKAVKSCLTCDVFLCETHIKNHYTVPALQKHKLYDVTGAMETKLFTLNLPTDFSSICGEQEKDSSISESGLNVFMPNEAAGISSPETDVQKYNTNATNLELMYSKLQQEVLGLKKRFSTFKNSSKRDKYDEENDGVEGSDDEERYKDSDEEENENSYDGEEDSFNYNDTDNDWSELDQSDESENDNDEDICNDEYDIDEQNDEDDEDENYEDDDYDDEYDEDEYNDEDETDEDDYNY